MKKTTYSVTVGIPAYNEEAGIALLLQDVLNQKMQYHILEKILIVSDGSSDGTVEKVKSFQDARIVMIDSTDRKGKSLRMNEIFEMSTSDIVIILDADCRLYPGGLQHVLDGFDDPSVGLVSGVGIPEDSEKYIQHVSRIGYDMWAYCKKQPGVSDLYWCDGTIRGFHKRFYTKLRLPVVSAEEAYSYIACIEHGYSFRVAHQAKSYHVSPATLKDLLSQTRRYIRSQNIQNKYFDENVVSQLYNIGFKIKLAAFFKYVFQKPIEMAVFLLIVMYARFLNLFESHESGLWTILDSTKNVKTSLPKVYISNYDDLHNPYYAGGGAHAVHEVARRLSTTYDITVVTGRYRGAQEGDVDGVIYTRIGSDVFGPYSGQLFYHVSLILFVMTHSFDVWVESFTPPFSTSCLQLFTRKPVVGLVHMLSGEDMRRKYRLPFDLVERIGLQTYKHIIVTTEAFKSKIQSLAPRAQCAVIPNGAHAIHIDSQEASHKKHILFIGRIEVNQKGLDLLVNAYDLIASRCPYDLVIAGSGSPHELAKLRILIETKSSSSRIHLPGRVSGSKKDNLFQHAIVCVVPSRFESFSIFALEALSCSLPLVTFDIEALQWIPNAAKITVSTFDTIAFGDALLALCTDEKLRTTMGEHARSAASDSTWDHRAEAYRHVIESVLTPSSQ